MLRDDLFYFSRLFAAISAAMIGRRWRRAISNRRRCGKSRERVTQAKAIGELPWRIVCMVKPLSIRSG
jgi:hypothetical protein